MPSFVTRSSTSPTRDDRIIPTLIAWLLSGVLLVCPASGATAQGETHLEYVAAIEQGFRASFHGENKAAIEAFEKATGIEPEHGEILYYLGMAYADEEQWRRAIECYRRSVELMPDNIEAWYAMGFAYFALGEWDACITSLQRALALDPDHARSYYVLGRAQNKLLQYAEAIVSLQKAIERNPDTVGAYHELGMAYLNQKRYREAIPYFEKAIELAPGYIQPHYGLGMAYLRLGEKEKGRAEMLRFQQLQREFQEYERLARLTHTEPDNVEAWRGLARILMKQKNYKEAIPVLQQVLKLAPKDADFHHLLAQAFMNLGYPGTARNSVLTAIQLNPNDANFYNTLGSTYAAEGDIASAIQAFLKAVALAPEVPYFHLNLAKLYEQIGRDREAAEHYRLYEKLRGETPSN